MNIMCKTQSPSAPGGRLAKDAFTIDLHAATVTCPAGQRAPLTVIADGQIARFGKACLGCPPAARCTTAPGGRTIHVGPYEAQVTRAHARQGAPGRPTTRPHAPRSNARSLT